MQLDAQAKKARADAVAAGQPVEPMEQPPTKPSRKRVKINRDESGNMMGADIEDVMDDASETSEGMNPNAVLPELKAETMEA